MSEKTDIHEFKEKNWAHRASSKATSLFLSKQYKQHQSIQYFWHCHQTMSCKSNIRFAIVIMTKSETGTWSWSLFLSESKGRRQKGKTHIQVQRLRFHDSARVKQLRQIGAEMVQDSKATIWGGAAGCKIEVQGKGGVRAESMSSLIVEAGERAFGAEARLARARIREHEAFLTRSWN